VNGYNGFPNPSINGHQIGRLNLREAQPEAERCRVQEKQNRVYGACSHNSALARRHEQAEVPDKKSRENATRKQRLGHISPHTGSAENRNLPPKFL
jgi:hypothetical protein